MVEDPTPDPDSAPNHWVSSTTAQCGGEHPRRPLNTASTFKTFYTMDISRDALNQLSLFHRLLDMNQGLYRYAGGLFDSPATREIRSLCYGNFGPKYHDIDMRVKFVILMLGGFVGLS